MDSPAPNAVPQRVSDARTLRRLVISACITAAAFLSLITRVFAAAANPFDLKVPVLGVGDQIPSTQFIDQTGKHVSLRDFGMRTLVLTFIYTSCTDECPLISAKFETLQHVLDPTKFHLVEVTVDPARDTPKRIAGYAHRFRADPAMWSVLTAKESELTPFWRAMGESVIAGARGEIIHNDRTIVVGPNAKIADNIDEVTWSPAQIAADAESAAGESASPLARADLALGKAVAFVCGGFQSGHAGIVDLIATLAVVVAFGLALYLIGRRIFGFSE